MKEVRIKAGKVTLNASLSIPEGAQCLVIFAHGSGSSRFSPRNNYVAELLQKQELATLLMVLLTEDEEKIDVHAREFRFDIPLLAERLVGASTGVAAALIAAAKLPHDIKAIVSRGGRPDLATDYLSEVKAPTLLIVGGEDGAVIGMNEGAVRKLSCEKKLDIVLGATHLFEEPGKLEEVAKLAKEWFQINL